MSLLLRKRNRFALWYESTPRPHLFLIGLIATLYVPSLVGDFMADDHRLLRVFREYKEGLRPAPNAYQFLSADAQNKIERAAGWYPWWLPDELKYRHFRPLSERFLYGEYLIFGESPIGFRLTGIALYIVGVLLVFKFLRLVGEDDRMARWGALIFTVAGCHAIPVVFISAHCDVLALVLSVAAALAAMRYLLNGSLSPLIASLVLFVAGLFSKEAVLPLVFWPFIARSIIRGQTDAARRARVLVSCWAMLAVAWLALYISAKCGANTSLMLDPIGAPVDYLKAAPLRVALLLSTWIIPLNPFLLEFQLGRGDLLIYYAAAGAVLLALVAAMFLLHHRRQRGIAAMALWPIAFLPILVCTPPDDRVMVLPSVGLAFLGAAWMTRPHDNGSFKLRRLPLALFISLQVLTTVSTIGAMGFMEHCAQNNLQAAVSGFNRPLQPGDEIFFVNCRYPYDGLFMQDRLHSVTPNSPADARLLSDIADPLVTRTGPATLRLESGEGCFFKSFLGRMGTLRGRAKQVGDEYDVGVMHCRIANADDRGVKAIEIQFEQPLDSGNYRFYWFPTDGIPRPWPIPPLSQ